MNRNDDEHDRLLHISLDWEKEWKAAEMPEYDQQDINPWASVVVHFKDLHDREDFFNKLGFPPRTNTSLTMKWTWWPPQDYQKWTDKSASATTVGPNKYPIYVISKGRWESRLTVRQLEHLGIPFKLVIEPQEFEQYAAAVDPRKILKLPTENYGGGCSIPARNFVWDHAAKAGHKKHWILDDNIQGFFEFNHNMKPKIRDYNPFEIVERFVDRHDNVGLAGMNYEFFVQRRNDTPPYYLNTRVYSCILIRHDLPLKEKWRGRYNEDTDLSLRVLKAGFSTVLFNYVLAKKVTTMIMKGGNTESLYQLEGEDGRLKMAQELMRQHPDIVKITHKWGRWQHQVNYAQFGHNRLDR
jgi:hypothetical protein